MRSRASSALCALGALCALTACSKDPQEENNGKTPVGQSQCARDESLAPDSSAPLTVNQPAQGFICPVEDQDWFSFDVAANERIIDVSLKLAAAISPVELTYAVWSAKADGSPDKVVALPAATQIGMALKDVHCVSPGKHFVVVRDEGNDNQDTRHAYELLVRTLPDPDPQEPNDTLDQARELTSGQTVTGAIACGGDEDWFKIVVPQDNLIRLRLASGIAQYQPTLRLIDDQGALIVQEENKSGTVAATNIDRFQVVPKAGTYYVVVSDDDGKQADPDTNYTLSFELIRDLDPNEPNNAPAEATPLAANPVNCVRDSGVELTATGTIGSPGDDDWFRIPLEGCREGIIEAEVEFDRSSWEFNAQVQATLTMVRGHTRSACTQDEECNALNLSCQGPYDCAGYFETCLPQGLCAGSTTCLPEGICGANVIQRRYECPPNLNECKPNQPVRPNRARLSAPLPNMPYIYLRVSDFQSNGAAPEATYTLRVKLRRETDTREPSNLFTNVLPDSLPVSRHQDFAAEVPVHDCTAGDCCDNSKWIEGNIGYENDLDWFKYPHPCPGQDCTMRFVYSVDGGPVDFVTNLYRGRDLWFTGFEVEERPMQAPIQGVLGGSTAQDRCFYAFQGHRASGMDPYYYYLVVRDLLGLYSDRATVNPDTRDFAPGQRYRFCVEKIADMCLEPPCKVYNDGCGQPQ